VGACAQGVNPGGASTHFLHSFKSSFLSRNLSQNAYYLKKKLQTSRSFGEFAPSSRICYSRLLLLYNFVEFVFSAKFV